ncbi:HTH DNA binding protein [Caulobacter virus Karma]|uniref:Putative winged-helix HTH DNA binding protein n=1 Tax=Caulobacter phage CcrSwift TaxID=2927984 RepID=K4JTR3_9CAUD|nr:HTH DNA binding protein [Caulobacter virus Karma]YP_006989926.1 HTH DNA binding protein [Caulobacter phage CcrSwift]AFU87715.1 putative winged-helix HTH DNA binding protein [Caulobacter virus Karma]AFU88511.1 putative winged-helix HTH DNA binding protein [Caulobacter phage CcrSwift]
MSRLRPLTDRDWEVLGCLIPTFRDEPIRWHTPMEVGGSNGSHHSATLAKLEKRGYVISEQRLPFMTRGSKRYQVTREGLGVYNDRRKQPWMTKAEWHVWWDENRPRKAKAHG